VERRLGRSYKLVKGNIERTHFAPDTFGLGISLSVIEHCVNLRRFFQETSRILKNGATLYVSTDYWDPKIATEGLFMYGIPWRIFCKSEILDAIDIAEEYGFKLRRDAAVPDVDKPVIYYFDKGYTFISLDMLLSK
jgi:SAM-dependent methyltransferase